MMARLDIIPWNIQQLSRVLIAFFFQWYGIAGLCAYTELACAVCSCPYST